MPAASASEGQERAGRPRQSERRTAKEVTVRIAPLLLLQPTGKTHMIRSEEHPPMPCFVPPSVKHFDSQGDEREGRLHPPTSRSNFKRLRQAPPKEVGENEKTSPAC